MSRSTLLDAAFVLALAVYVLAGTPVVPFHADESTILSMSRDYASLFLAGDAAALRYRDEAPDPAAQSVRLVNGTLSTYAYGLAWHVAGHSPAELNGPWDWGGSWEYNLSSGHMPAEGILRAARWASALASAASVAVLFALARLADGRLPAWLASAVYALHPAVLLNGRRAMFEGVTMLTALLVVLAGLLYLRRATWPRAAALGAAAGLALAAKHQNVIPVGVVLLACLGYTLAARSPGMRSALARLAVVGLVALVTFFVLTPAWWGADLGRAVPEIARLRLELIAGQTATFGGYVGRLDQVAGFGRQALVGLPMFYEVPLFADRIADEIARYEASPWRGVAIGGSVPGAVALALLALGGAVAYLRDRARPRADRWLLGAWGAALILTTLLLTPLEWQRYYLPVLPVLGLYAAFGLSRLARRVLRWRKPSGAHAS